MEFIATCPRAFEGLLADELKALGLAGVRPLTGQVSFSGELEDGLRACMWSRLASRVVLVLARFDAGDAAALYEGVRAVAWEEHLTAATSFAFDAHGGNASLRNTRFVAEKAKDALVDRMFSLVGARPQVNVREPDLTLALRVSGARAMVGLALSGTRPLFERGRAGAGTGASGPRADYAAALLALAGAGAGAGTGADAGAGAGANAGTGSAVGAGAGASGPRADYAAAMLALAGAGAGAGTGAGAICAGAGADMREALVLWGGAALAAEAAGVLAGKAPGLSRVRWGFDRWLGKDDAAWQRVVDAAREAAAAAPPVRLYVFDPREKPSAYERALRAEGLSAQVKRLSEASLAAGALEAAAPVVADLAAGRGDAAAEAALVSPLSQAATAAPAGSALATLGSAALAQAAVGAKATQTLATQMGSAEVELARFELPGAGCAEIKLAGGEPLSVLVPASDQFAARLSKVAKLRAREADREFVSCYRVYDADLPDYNVAIDLLKPLDGSDPWAVVAEYAPPKGVDADLARMRLADVLAIAPRVLGVPAGNLVCRVRERSRGGSQYADVSDKARPRTLLVDEGGLTFELELSRRHDYGIFLDHRDTRSMIREMMKTAGGDQRFLNLFCYTGTATAYAVDGGARASVSVDLSRPSLEVAKRNLERNGLAGPEHRFVQADVLQWVQDQRHARGGMRYELIFCDVPTFSNSQRMRKSSFDVQRDHAELLIGVSRLLAKGGTCVFSCNLRSFKPDVAALAKAGVTIEDITAQTIPFDFARTPKVHRCYLVRRG